MLRNLLFLMPVLIFFFSSFLLYNNDIIIWEQGRALTWNDFKGKPAKRFAAASTSYDIIKTINLLNKEAAIIKVQAVFFCNKSWKKKSWISDFILTHEQRHFDIVELFSRKYRKLLIENKDISIDNIEIISDSLYSIIDIEMDNYHNKYDDETEGSMNSNQQIIWNSNILLEIKKLNKFKDTEFTLRFN